MSTSRRTAYGATIVVAAGIIAYANGLTGTFVGYNAQRSLVDNAAIRSLTPLSRALGLHLIGDAARADGGTLVRRPITSLSFALNYVVSGPDARWFQATNIAIHLACGLLLFGLVRRTLGASSSGETPSAEHTGAAASIAALWVVHPLTTESVTYVIQRAESLAAMFALATLYASCRFFADPRRFTWATVAVGTCAAGMATKENAAIVPVLVWLYGALFFRTHFLPRSHAVRWFLGGLAITWLIPIILVLLTLDDVAVDFRTERMASYFLAQPRVLLEYVHLALWPSELHLYSNTTRFTDLAAPEILLSGVIIGVAILATLRGVAQQRPAAFLPAGFFLLLAPTSLIATNDVIQEHRAYLPLAAVLCGTFWGTQRILRQVCCDSQNAGRMMLALTSIAIVALAARTHTRNADYRDAFAAYYPADLSMAYGALARHAAVLGRWHEAEDLLRTALALPEAAFGQGPPHRRYDRGRAHNDLGAVLAMQGRYEEARQQLQASLATEANPVAATINLAVVDAMAGEPRRALAELARAPLATEWECERLVNLGAIAALAGDVELARRSFQRVLELEPRAERAAKNRTALGGEFLAQVDFVRSYDDAILYLRLVAIRPEGPRER